MDLDDVHSRWILTETKHLKCHSQTQVFKKQCRPIWPVQSDNRVTCTPADHDTNYAIFTLAAFVAHNVVDVFLCVVRHVADINIEKHRRQ